MTKKHLPSLHSFLCSFSILLFHSKSSFFNIFFIHSIGILAVKIFYLISSKFWFLLFFFFDLVDFFSIIQFELVYTHPFTQSQCHQSFEPVLFCIFLLSFSCYSIISTYFAHFMYTHELNHENSHILLHTGAYVLHWHRHTYTQK